MDFTVDKVLDCKGLACPMPIVRTKKTIEQMEAGQVLEMQATDKGSVADIQGWAKTTGHDYLGTETEGDVFKHYLRKACPQATNDSFTYPQTISNALLLKKLEAREEIIIVDVRESAEYADGHIPGAKAIPYGELEGRWGELNPDQEILVVCRTGNRSDLACRFLAEKGFSKLKNVLPGMSGWSGPVETKMITMMTAKDVATMVKNKEELFILDVRNQTDYQDWRMEGEQVESINIPYFDLIDGVDGVLDQIPAHKKLLVVCAKEGSSKFVAEKLAEAGLEQVAYLQGGMKSWSEHLEQVLVHADESMKVYQYLRMGKGCLSYMVVSGGEALVIDPSRFTDVYLDAAKHEGAKITHIVDSHLHADHISGGKQLAQMTGADYYMMKSEGAVFSFKPLEEHDRIRFAQIELRVLAVKTPGHSPGSVSFFVNDKLLFSGDTLFVGGLGRPDLGGKAAEWARDLYDTVYEKMAAMADDVIVLPGHYAELDREMNESGYVGAQLGVIRAANELMNQQDKKSFVDQVVAHAKTETPPNYEEIIAINRGVEEATAERQQELEIGPNRCALHHTHE